MKEEIKFSAALAAFGNPGDRFISHYKVDRPLTLSMGGICEMTMSTKSRNTSISIN
jgi:hypothetical protein